MNFSAWSIRNPIAPLLLFAMLVVVGVQSFYSLPITRFPNIDVPIVSVKVSQPGAAPAELEKQVTKKIEDAVAGITGVKHITSTVTDSMSTTAVEFRMEVPTEQAVQNVKDEIDKIRSDLPATAEEPVVQKIDVEGQAIETYAVASPDMTLEQLSWFVDDVVQRRLQGQKGIGRVDRYGGADREIRVELDPLKLESFGITAAQVNQQLKAINSDLGSGRGEIAGREQTIRTLGDAESAAKLADTTISLPNGRFVELGKLGRVVDTYEELRSFSRYDGRQVVTFAVFRSKGASEVTVDQTVKATLGEIRAAHPDVTISRVDDTVSYTYGNYTAAMHTLMEGAALAVLVVLLFLRNWRATLISALALPLSAIPTFWAMEMLGFSLNLVSFLAITLATGILVDDAIVEIENISRHIRMGKSPYRAAIDAADEIGLAVIATTFTIVAVFVPVSFMGGVPGQYFSQFGLTVAVAVFFSLMVARLITPLVAAYFMRPGDAEAQPAGDGLVMRRYMGFIRHTLKWRYTTLFAAVGILVVSVYFMAQIPGSFMPAEDVSRISASIELPPGAQLADTDAATEKVREIAAAIPGVAHVFVLGGSSPKGELDVRRASVTVLLKKKDDFVLASIANGLIDNIPFLRNFVRPVPTEGRSTPQWKIESELFAKLANIPDLRVYKLNDRGDRDISFNLLSSNEKDLNAAAARLEGRLRGDPLLADVSSEGALPRPEIQITPRMGQAARLGVTTQQISQTVRVATIGDVNTSLAKVSVGDRLIPVRVQIRRNFRESLERLKNIRVPTADGRTVPLNAVADLRIGQGPSAIDRYDRERRVTIGATLPSGVALNTATARFKKIAAEAGLPSDVRFAESGDAEVQNELMHGFAKAMLLGLMLVLTVLILLFKDVIQPFTILLSLPLAIGGVAAALIITGNPVSMPVLIGMLMLMGIVTKNAILLVDFAIEMKHRGMGRLQAVMEACHKRARPIIMTSIAMSAGMLPSAIGLGDGGAFRAPMAIAVIGGIIVSTALSLVVVPSFFLIMDDLSRLLARLFGRFVGEKEAEPSAADALVERVDQARSMLVSMERRLTEMERRQAYAGPRIIARPDAAE